MQIRFRRGAISIGQITCAGCGHLIQHGEYYLTIDEKPTEKVKDETVFISEIGCSECNKNLSDQDKYALILDGDSEKIVCQSCIKKKGGDTYIKKNNAGALTFNASPGRSQTLFFCIDCCEKRKAGIERKEKGEKIFTFFPGKSSK